MEVTISTLWGSAKILKIKERLHPESCYTDRPGMMESDKCLLDNMGKDREKTPTPIYNSFTSSSTSVSFPLSLIPLYCLIFLPHPLDTPFLFLCPKKDCLK